MQTRPSATVQTGEQFGTLTVIETGLRLAPSESQRARQRPGSLAVLCECVCGRQRLAAAGRLILGDIKSCARDCPGRRGAPRPASTPPAPASDQGPEQGGSHVVRGEEPPKPRRGGRGPTPILGLEAFEPLIAEFLVAASMDSGFAVNICEAATNILAKRLTWSVRLELRAAEAAARAKCAASDLTSCEVQNPCSVGACPFAPPQLAHLTDVPAEPASKHGTKTRAVRPQPRRGPGYRYTIEAAVPVLVAERADQPPDTRTQSQRHQDSMSLRRREALAPGAG
jgi:hypothetical protein